MNDADLKDLLENDQSGSIDPTAAAGRIAAALRASPFTDLGFARVDTHREIRQGFPEVVLGLGKSPEQVARIAVRKSEHPVQFLQLPGFSYFSVLAQKLHWRGSSL